MRTYHDSYIFPFACIFLFFTETLGRNKIFGKNMINLKSHHQTTHWNVPRDVSEFPTGLYLFMLQLNDYHYWPKCCPQFPSSPNMHTLTLSEITTWNGSAPHRLVSWAHLLPYNELVQEELLQNYPVNLPTFFLSLSLSHQHGTEWIFKLLVVREARLRARMWYFQIDKPSSFTVQLTVMVLLSFSTTDIPSSSYFPFA